MDFSRNGTMVFVGCGGTFWTGGNYFSSLIRRMNPHAVHFVDPDQLTEANTERQWCTHNMAGRDKARLAMEEYCPIGRPRERAAPYVMTFQEYAENWLPDTGPVILFVNVDNDDARLAIREWCYTRDDMTLMIMSGCDMNYGQVYYGVYRDKGAIHDWFPLHTDVGGDKKPIQQNDGGCGAQSTLSNFVTSSLFAPATLHATKFLGDEADWPEQANEWYWRRDKETGTMKVWTQQVQLLADIGEVL